MLWSVDYFEGSNERFRAKLLGSDGIDRRERD